MAKRLLQGGGWSLHWQQIRASALMRPNYVHWDWELDQGTGPGKTNREEE